MRGGYGTGADRGAPPDATPCGHRVVNKWNGLIRACRARALSDVDAASALEDPNLVVQMARDAHFVDVTETTGRVFGLEWPVSRQPAVVDAHVAPGPTNLRAAAAEGFARRRNYTTASLRTAGSVRNRPGHACQGEVCAAAPLEPAR